MRGRAGAGAVRMHESEAEREARAKELFLQAAELPPAEGQALVARLCGADREQAARVRALLAAHARAEGLVAGALRPRASGEGLAPGAWIGDYRLLSTIGEGGFGTVWRAEQSEPVRRQVALKVLKAGLDTREVVARFQAERQALALMDHPCIAKVFDGGSTAEGRPWFAMELVPGRPLTEFCERQALGMDERLQLFLDVCRAVQHAHQKGVIHRDLKPSNVLVAELDGRALPKVIDFGIAKAIDQPLVERTLATRGGQLVGTPAYMSPEQAAGSTDIDTRSDVYALGVLLYEILSGTTPFELERPGVGLEELRRRILEVDPPRPSTRLSERAAAGGPKRTTALARRVRGDLDWIVMRCLEKDRDRRYASASQLAADLQRHLDGEPVLAGPPSALYRATKFARRHRLSLSALAAVFLALLAGVVVSSLQAARARRAEASAAAEAERARIELGRYEAIARFLEDVLLSIDPAIARERDTELLRDVLERAAGRVGEAALPPEVEATLRHTIGFACFSLALFAQAQEQLGRALELRERELGPDHPETLSVANDLGALLLQTGELAEAERLLQRAIDGRRALLGPEHEQTLQALGSLLNLRRLQGRLAEAEALGRELERIRIARHGELHAGSILSINNLARTLDERGKRFEAQERFERALRLNEELNGPTHPNTLAALNNLAGSYQDAGRLEEALDLYLGALQHKQELFEPDHPSVILALNNVAQLCRDLGRLEEAETLYAEALALSLGRFGERHRQSAILLFNRALVLLQLGRHEEAQRDLARAAESAEALGLEPELARQAREALQAARAGR